MNHGEHGASIDHTITRRRFLGTSAAATAALTAGCATPSVGAAAGIVDTHTHFYDPARPQGVPWPPKNDPLLYRRVLPEDLKPIAQPLGVRGTIVVEASPWVEDNQWVLDLARREPFILGLVGHLKPGRPGFSEDLARFRANPLFRGIRTGLWGMTLDDADSRFVNDLRLLANADLSLDLIANTDLLPTVARLAAAVPDLRIVVDHCAGVRVTGGAPDDPWRDAIGMVVRHHNVFMKVSGLAEGTGRTQGDAPADVDFYRPVLDFLWDSFGEDRVIFGSNWPVCERFASYATVLGIVRQYIESKGADAARKYFHGNAARIYRWPAEAVRT
jgi:predicted TIM-barrel fold metal-dependent hydrolase